MQTDGVGVYLAADHDMSNFRFAVTAVRLVVSGTDGQNEIARVALALSHQKAAVLAFLRQQLFGLSARQVTVEPSEKSRQQNPLMIHSPALRVKGLTLNPEPSVFPLSLHPCG